MEKQGLSFWREEKGQALAEAAWVLPILTAILLGIMIFGYLMYSKLVVIDSARDGARHLALGLGNPTSVVENVIDLGRLKRSNIVSVTQQNLGDYVNVTVRYKQDTFVPGIGILLGGTSLNDQTGCNSCIYLEHTATFKKEN